MKFKSIAIENLFSYYGLKEFNFDNSDKPVALIIGENGFGKTSFINSVKIALHSITKDVLNIGSQTLSKEDFILGNSKKQFSGMLNTNAKDDGINQAKIRIVMEDDEIIIAERVFTFTANSHQEDLKLYDEENNILAEGDDAQDIINQKISPNMAKFFFFDGEKIQTIADFSHAEFTKMLEDVLELDIYDQMVSDAEYLIRKIKKSELDQDAQTRVEDKENKLEKLEEGLFEKQESLTHESKIVLKDLEREKRELDNKLKKLKSRFQEPLENARQNLKDAETKQTELTSKFKTVLLVQLPLLLNSDLMKKVRKDIDTNYRGKVQISKEVLNIKREQLGNLLKNSSDYEKFMNVFDKIFQSSSEQQSVTYADPHKIEQQFDALPQSDLNLLLTDLSDNAYRTKELNNEILELENKIADDKKEYEADFELLAKLDENIIRQTVKCETIENDIRILEVQIKEIRKELGKLTILEHKNDLANAKIDALNSIINVSMSMKKKIKIDKRTNLEKSINSKFKLLRKEGYDADKIVLDENFNISLYDVNKKAMGILSCSSGQKQVIATALIWGISEFIAENLPMVIDTPLGRLDEKNQSLILNEFYPNVSKQVIILPTPSELKHEGFHTLADHVSQTFRLINPGSATTVEDVNVRDLIKTKEIA